MHFVDRIVRHSRISWKAYQRHPSPPFLILFINSICNQKCEHCFYWRSLNQRDDLSKEELFALSRSMGRIENLNLSGGEPFLRAEFAEICRHFIRQNKVRQIYVPTNASFADRTVRQIADTLNEKDLDLFCVEISLDGLGAFHDHFRGMKGAFDRAMATYDELVKLQEKDPRLRIHSISTATADNMDEIRRLTTYLYDRCPNMDHHNLAMIRGDRKNPALQGPGLAEYKSLYDYIQRLWANREQDRYGSIVEPLLQEAKYRIVTEKRQVVPCKAGVLSGVVYANGDVALCETHPPVGNLRKNTFPEIWESEAAEKLRDLIRRKECYCTLEIALWSSFTYQPPELVKLMVGAKVWQKPKPLAPEDREPVTGSGPKDLVSIQPRTIKVSSES
jgi:MoaA/NifB/PqqE/SkfB family radical SAM enzyme